ncbi:MAG: hypothetical protein LBJ67_11650 [Planctomycetaceae bacterium]|jgi:hypothetical protein|nr:hypothetical protein [Planctomycetaceae bacterium]
MFRITEVLDGLDYPYQDNLFRKHVHYVSWAIPGLTFAQSTMELFVKGIENAKDMMFKINHQAETGTLYPVANITLMPVTNANYYQENTIHKNIPFSKEEENKQWIDVFNAHKLMATELMIVDCRDKMLAMRHVDTLSPVLATGFWNNIVQRLKFISTNDDVGKLQEIVIIGIDIKNYRY